MIIKCRAILKNNLEGKNEKVKEKKRWQARRLGKEKKKEKKTKKN